MKIALVVTGGLHPSGREQIIPVLYSYILELAKHHDVHAFALRHLATPQRYAIGGATIHDLGRPLGLVQQYRTLVSALTHNGPFDVLHGYFADPGGVVAASAGTRLRIPCVVTCASGEFVSLPDIDYGLQRSWRGRAVTTIATRLATVVHVISMHMQSLARRHHVDSVCIPFGIDIRHFARDAASLGTAPCRLLQVASLNPVKDQSTLLHALARIRQSIDVRLDLVGEDTLGGRLQREAHALGLSDAVTFHGFLPQDQLSKRHAEADLYVQSSRHEAAGVAVLEAAAANLPVVGTNVGYVADWDGSAAMGVAPGDPQSLADAVLSLLHDHHKRQALAAAGHARVQDYAVEHTTRRMVTLYESLAGNAG